MMSMNELLDQIKADKKVIFDSKDTDEYGWPIVPLEVQVRFLVFGQVARWIEDDFIWRTEYQPEGDAERERLEAAGFEASYDERDIAKYADEVSSSLDDCLASWSRICDTWGIPLLRWDLGVKPEQVRELAEAFLEELM